MSDRRKTPSYRRHKATGQGIMTLTDPAGRRKDILLGPYNSKASLEKYRAKLAEWEGMGRAFPAAHTVTVNDLLLRFWDEAGQRYSAAEQTNWQLSLRQLRQLYGTLPVNEFSPLKLKAVREAFLKQPVTRRCKTTDPKTGKTVWVEKVLRVGLARGVVNQRTWRIKKVFKWGVENELVPATVYHALAAVEGLARGRSTARETEKVKPVPQPFVEAVLPFVTPPVRAMIELQAVTGMRPGEVCIMRACDIDMTGDHWLYRPHHHKNEWRGLHRIIPLGPRAQEIIKPFLKLDTQAFLFSPRDAVETFRAQRKAARKTRVQPSQQKRTRKRKPKRQPAACYRVSAYAHAIARACQRAGLPKWSPNKLRHSFATEVRRSHGIEAAQVLLGHQKIVMTEHYAEKNLGLATRVASEIG